MSEANHPTPEKRAGLRIEYRAFLAAYNAAHIAQQSYEKV